MFKDNNLRFDLQPFHAQEKAGEMHGMERDYFVF